MSGAARNETTRPVFVTGYRQAYASYMCAMEGHQVVVSATSTAPQPFLGGVCSRCGEYIKPDSRALGWEAPA